MQGGVTRATNTIRIKLLPVSISRSTLYSILKDAGHIMDIRIERHGNTADACLVFESITDSKRLMVCNHKYYDSQLAYFSYTLGRF